jgi:hypothetical protein
MALYQHASDWIPGVETPYSGVIKTDDGKWVACQATRESQAWTDYLAWAAIEGNIVDPYLAPEAGGVAIVLDPEQVAVGSMLDSLPLAPEVTKPRVVDIPNLSGTTAIGDTLTCTMGNWQGEPTDYDGQWLRRPTGGDPQSVQMLGTGPTHVITVDDQGCDIVCVVTATNGFGSITAPPSNVIAVPAAVEAGAGAGVAAAPAAEARAEEHHGEHRNEHHRNAPRHWE